MTSNKWFDTIEGHDYSAAYDEYMNKNSGTHDMMVSALVGEITRLINQLSILGPINCPLITYSDDSFSIDSHEVTINQKDGFYIARLFMIFVILRGVFECNNYDSTKGSQLIKDWISSYNQL